MQIDVTIQPGNSGGPLMNSAGHFVGIVISTLNSYSLLMKAHVTHQKETLKGDHHMHEIKEAAVFEVLLTTVGINQ
jgi:hypothetical protein